MNADVYPLEDSSRRNLLVLAALLSLSLVLLAYQFFLRPLQEEIASLESRIGQLESSVLQSRALQARLPAFQKELQLQRQRLQELRQILPEQKETAEIIRQVQQLALQCNLDLQRFAPQAAVNNDYYEDWPILLSMQGNYHNLGKFFEEIGRFQRLINIENISIETLGSTDPGRTVSATCTATTFVYREEEEANQTALQEKGPAAAVRRGRS